MGQIIINPVNATIMLETGIIPYLFTYMNEVGEFEEVVVLLTVYYLLN